MRASGGVQRVKVRGKGGGVRPQQASQPVAAYVEHGYDGSHQSMINRPLRWSGLLAGSSASELSRPSPSSAALWNGDAGKPIKKRTTPSISYPYH